MFDVPAFVVVNKTQPVFTVVDKTVRAFCACGPVCGCGRGLTCGQPGCPTTPPPVQAVQRPQSFYWPPAASR